jgi:hypothetical protein
VGLPITLYSTSWRKAANQMSQLLVQTMQHSELLQDNASTGHLEGSPESQMNVNERLPNPHHLQTV